MKRTAIAIAVGALSIGLTQGLLAQETQGQQTQGQQTQVRVEGEPADVTVKQEPAEIKVEQQAPKVTVEQQPPKVTIEQPDPNITVEQAEPNVTVEQVGKADVEVIPAEQVNAKMGDPDADKQTQAKNDLATSDGLNKNNGLTDREISQIEGYTIYSQADDEEIGDVKRVVRDTETNDIYVVITKGGFLGFGKDEMGFKIDDLELRNDDELVARSSDHGEPGDYSSDRYVDIDGNQTLYDAMQRN